MDDDIYITDGVARAALGSAKNIKVSGRETRRGQIGTVAAGPRRMIGSWSQRSGMYCARAVRGAMHPASSGLGVRTTPVGGDGARVDCDPNCWRGWPAERAVSCGTSIVRISRCITMAPIPVAARPSKRLAGARAESTPSWRRSWTLTGERWRCAWRRAIAMTSRPSSRLCPRLAAGASWATKALMQVTSGRNCTGSGRGSASLGCAAGASPCPSIAATTVAATELKFFRPTQTLPPRGHTLRQARRHLPWLRAVCCSLGLAHS